MADEAPTPKSDNPYSTLLAILGGGVALALVIFAIGFVAGDDGGGGGGDASGSSEISLSEFQINGNLNVAEGATLSVSNAGTQVHNLKIDGDGGTADLNPGDAEELSLKDLSAGTYTVYCSIAGHREAGMEADLVVGGSGSESASGSGSSGSGDSSGSSHGGAGEITLEQGRTMSDQMIESFQPFVGQLTSGKLNTEGLGGQDLAPTILPDGTKEFRLTAEIVDWEVTPGETVKAWTYNGTVPAPTIRGEVGDRIRVVLENKLPVDTDIHMHGMVLPNDQDGVAPITQDPIKPGETYTYQYTVTEPAVAMYHPHLMAQEGIPNGMWGSMIFSPAGGGGNESWLIPRGETISGVTIPQDVQPVMYENMVLNDAGVIGLSLNGKGFPATEPYAMKTGDWAVFNYYSEGLLNHTMHLHQFPQLVIARDGIPLESPYWADTINIGPGERYTVLFQASKPGAWVWHCHILNHAEGPNGMFGMVTAIAVS